MTSKSSPQHLASTLRKKKHLSCPNHLYLSCLHRLCSYRLQLLFDGPAEIRERQTAGLLPI